MSLFGEKKLGFGCMRLPMNGSVVDEAEFCKMVDAFLEAGFTYFDTAHGYLQGESEKALKKCLTSRYDRDRYLLTNKLSNPFFNSQEEIRPLFESQLEACGVTYFDFYLMHAQSRTSFEKFKKCRAYETAMELKEEGKIRHLGISFHDTAEVLDRILTEYPQVEAVQLQFNYIDYEDERVQGRKCYEVCQKHGKRVLVMEPVKGGRLAGLPEEASSLFASLGGGSDASYAVRWAAGFDLVEMVLSGMSNLEQTLDNISYMKDFAPLSEKEQEAVAKVCEIIKKQKQIPCTVCKYCVDGCPAGIPIPSVIACLNMQKQYESWDGSGNYALWMGDKAKASACIGCGACENECPQHLPIRELMAEAAKQFE